MNSDVFINNLIQLGWKIEPEYSSVDITNEEFLEKIDKASVDFKSFIKQFGSLTNSEDTIWFLSFRDYMKENDEHGFAWNEFELQSLEAAEDEEEVANIRSFWNEHLPFMLSVKNGYAYFAIVLDGADKGKIVIGNEPMYEETTVVAESLSDFFDLFISFLNGEKSPAAFNILK